MTTPDFFNLDPERLKIQPNPATHYLQFFLSEHPLAGQNGMVNFARHVASQKLGRWLTPNEVVVHADKSPRFFATVKPCDPTEIGLIFHEES
jgi:hypothetical protein